MVSPQSSELESIELLIAPYLRDGSPRYTCAQWLMSSFDAHVWLVATIRPFEINWSLPLPDGTLLIAPKHSRLLGALKSWLIARTHVDTTGGLPYSGESLRAMLIQTLVCIDYLLLRSMRLGILRYGLEALSENDLKAMLATVGSHTSAARTVYEWPQRVAVHLRSKLQSLTAETLRQALMLEPQIARGLPDVTERLTDLSDDEIVRSRAWLLLTNGYRTGLFGYRLWPRARLLAGAIYCGTTHGKAISFPVPRELCVAADSGMETEYPRSRVTSPPDTRLSSPALSGYIATLQPLTLLRSEGLNAPAFSLDALKQFGRSLNTKRPGRFRTLPQDVAYSSLRRSIEFVLRFGDALVDSYLAVAAAAHAAGLSIASYAERCDISPLLTDACKGLGVKRWMLQLNGLNRSQEPQWLDKSEWYAALRSNQSLYEMIRVLYGAIQVVVGLTMARRSGELIDLVAGQCLNASGDQLLFRNRKSGLAGGRNLEGRPIPRIAARFVRLLERLQAGLLEMGAIAQLTNLFACPRSKDYVGLSQACQARYSESLDLFCDWAQTALDHEGRRYYLRQHQMRRFFAMLFFWGGGFGGMDPLRWFLGHTNVEHLWHYITESTPGVTVRTVAAQWASYCVKHATGEAEALAAEVREWFGTSDISILDDEALCLHLEDLMEEGRLTIEPQFLDGGRSYRIAVVLRSKLS